MSDANLRTVAAFALLGALATSFGLGAYIGISRHGEEQQYQSYLEPFATRPRIGSEASAPSKFGSLNHREPCKEINGREESELCAQWRAAKAAEDSAFWAKSAFWIAVAGTFAIIVTLVYTRKAVLAAEEASQDADRAIRIAAQNADAATNLAKTADATAERQLRAYLAVRSIILDESAWDEDRMQIAIELQNAGQTPGIIKDVHLKAMWGVGNGDRSITLLDHTSKNEVACHRGSPMTIPFTFQDTAKELQETGVLIVLGRVEYTDVFGQIRKEPFSFQTPNGSNFYLPFHDHVLPLRLAAFSATTMIDQIEARKNNNT